MTEMTGQEIDPAKTFQGYTPLAPMRGDPKGGAVLDALAKQYSFEVPRNENSGPELRELIAAKPAAAPVIKTLKPDAIG